ncbi:MAG TPA: transposase [Candidatus Methylacidiphilales bacterium]|jgi:putative transposase|nr:transposase [Candidatus Methylacidiphilales bacterium]
MSKRRILDLPGQYHFLTFSTYQRRRFLDSGETRNIVLEVLQKCLVTQRANCAGFVVMPDHVHALISGEEDFKISPFVQVWKKTSSYRIKRFFERELGRYEKLCPNGCPIWQARFYDYNVDSDEKLNEKIEYMHENPVAAGLAENALDWNWSSSRFYERGEMVGVTITP